MLPRIVDLKIAVKIGLALALTVLVAVCVSAVSLRNRSTIEETAGWTEHTP